MSNYEFLLLKKSESLKLFIMRFKKRVNAKFLGASLDFLLSEMLIKPNHNKTKNIIGSCEPDGTFSLTDRYVRYCIYKRNCFYNSFWCPLIVSIIASISTTVLTTYILQQLTGK